MSTNNVQCLVISHDNCAELCKWSTIDMSYAFTTTWK